MKRDKSSKIWAVDRERLLRALRDFERGRKVSHLTLREKVDLVAVLKHRIAEIDENLRVPKAAISSAERFASAEQHGTLHVG